MFNFGDELIIDTYRIPWLIWIQLLVMFLLIILLYFFNIDPSIQTAVSSSAPPAFASSGNLLFCSTTTAGGDFLPNNTQVRENEIIKETSTSRGIARRDDIQETEGCSAKDGTSTCHFGQSHHPCHFLGLAKQAFLKCLGLDFSSGSSSNGDRREES